jgi:hypothetical protein
MDCEYFYFESYTNQTIIHLGTSGLKIVDTAKSGSSETTWMHFDNVISIGQLMTNPSPNNNDINIYSFKIKGYPLERPYIECEINIYGTCLNGTNGEYAYKQIKKKYDTACDMRDRMVGIY